jgi:hypothetical protein
MHVGGAMPSPSKHTWPETDMSSGHAQSPFSLGGGGEGVVAVKGGFGELKKPNNSPTLICNHGNP